MLTPSRALMGMRSGLDAELFEKGGVFRLDGVELLLAVVDEVHLVDENAELLEAEHGDHVAVALAVFHALRVDHEEGGFGACGTGDHVLQKLDVAGGVSLMM